MKIIRNCLLGASILTSLFASGIALAQDTDGSLTFSPTVSEPVSLPWTADTVGEAVDLFDFNLSDGGGTDGLAMVVTRVILNVAGTSTDFERTKVTWRLDGPDAVAITGTYSASGNTITFDVNISIADGAVETYTINGFYNDNTGLSDGATVILSVDGDEDLNIDSGGTQMGLTSPVTNGPGTMLVDDIGPTVFEVTPVSTPSSDSTPNVTFSTNEAGTLAVGGSCGSASEGATASGNNTITLTQSDNSTALASGTYSDCTITVTDSAGNASNTLSLTAFVIDVSDPTLDTNAGLSVDEGDTGEVIANSALAASDNSSSAANVTFTLVTAPTNGTLRNNGSALAGSGTFTQSDVDNNLLTYDHGAGEAPSDTFTFNLSDGAGNVNSNSGSNFTFSITVTNVNDPPVTTADTDVTDEDNAVLVDVLSNDSDPDGSLVASSVTVTVASTNGGTSVNPGTGVITYTPDANFFGVDTFFYTVEDNDSEPSSATLVTITVNEQNDAPVAVADNAGTLINTLVAIDVAANDTDVDQGDAPDPTTVVVVGAASNGSAVFNGGTNQVDYTPNGGFLGSDSFTYTIDDSNGATSNTATVTVTVSEQVLSSSGPGGFVPIPVMHKLGSALFVLLMLVSGGVAARRLTWS